MPKTHRDIRAPGHAAGMLLAVAASLLVHAGLYLVAHQTLRMPDPGFELVVPMEVELGITQAPDPAAAAEPSDATSEPPPAPAAPDDPPSPASTPATKPEPDEPTERRAETKRPAGTQDAGTTSEPAVETPGQLLAQGAPEGTQLAMCLDLARLDDSPIADEIAEVIARSPDWQLLLGGSGIDPLEDLERLFVASPDLRREHLVVAGRHRRSANLAREAVEAMAAERGEPATWRRRHGLRVAPWHDAEPGERLLALVGPRDFILAPPEMLPRVLQVARGMSDRAPREREQPGSDSVTAPLLALDTTRGEVAALSVEGARAFVRGRTTGVPTRLRLSVRGLDPRGATVHAVGHYESAAAAKEAAAFWERLRDRYASQPLIALMGFSATIRGTHIEARDERLEVRAELSLRELRVLLSFARSAMEGGRPPAQLPSRDGVASDPLAAPPSPPSRPAIPPPQPEEPHDPAGPER